MNDVIESWSLPWHTLQHSLAKDFGAETAATAARCARAGGASVRPPFSAARLAAVPTGSWLVRARRVEGRPAAARANR